MNSISNQFYLEKNLSKEFHRLFCRVSKGKEKKKIYSDFLVPEACWVKKENRTIARSNNSQFKDLPRYFSKTSQANEWIEMIQAKVEDVNKRMSQGEDFTIEMIVDYLKGNLYDLVVPVESELLFSDFLLQGYYEHIRFKKAEGDPLSYNTTNNYDYYRRAYTEMAGEDLLAINFDQKTVDRITNICMDNPDRCNTTIRSMFGPVRIMIGRAMSLHLLPASYVAPTIPTIKDSEPKLKTRLTMSQFEQLKSYESRTPIAMQARDSMLMAFFGCGMRMSEVIGLRMRHLNPRMKMFQYYAKKQKKMSPMYQMSDRFWEYAEKYYEPKADPDTFLLPKMRPFSDLEFNVNEGALDKRFAKLRDRFNYWFKKISKELNFPEDFTTHSARKSFALSMYEATGDIFLVKELLNHTKIETTQVYLAKNGVRTIHKEGDAMDYFDQMYERDKNKAINAQQIRKIG
jgi:site-specific recombinase XerD